MSACTKRPGLVDSTMLIDILSGVLQRICLWNMALEDT